MVAEVDQFGIELGSFLCLAGNPVGDGVAKTSLARAAKDDQELARVRHGS